MNKFFKYERIRDLREDGGILQRDVAQYLGITQNLYSYYERGDRKMPIEFYAKLARYYGTSVDYLLGETDERKPYPRAK